jgi:hypothetical protein
MNLNTLLREVAQSRFYGKLELEYKAGRLTLIRRNQTILPDSEGTDSQTERSASCQRDEPNSSRS